MKLKLLAATVLILALGINTTEAQTRQTTRIQKHRVKLGIRRGELTRVETRRIAQLNRNTRHDIRRAKSDGFITRRERREIRGDKRHTSRVIYRKRHNLRNRY